MFIIAAMSYIQKLNFIKPLINISHCFTAIFQSGWHFNTINFIIDYTLTWDVDLQSNYIVNYWTKLNRVLSYLTLFMILSYFNMCIFGGLRSQRHSTPGQHTIQIKFVFVVNIRPIKVKVKSSMARSLPVENLLPQKVGSIINYFQ